MVRASGATSTRMRRDEAAPLELLRHDSRQQLVPFLVRVHLVAQQALPVGGREPLAERQRVGMGRANAPSEIIHQGGRVAMIRERRRAQHGARDTRGLLAETVQTVERDGHHSVAALLPLVEDVIHAEQNHDDVGPIALEHGERQARGAGRWRTAGRRVQVPFQHVPERRTVALVRVEEPEARTRSARAAVENPGARAEEAREPCRVARPFARITASRIASRRRASVSGSVSRVSATTATSSVPRSGSRTPKATTHPWRTPATELAAFSMSCGAYFMPPITITSLRRVTKKRSGPAK